MKTVSASVLIVVAYFLVVAETQTTLKPTTGCNCCSSCGLTTTTPKPITTTRTTTTPKPTTTTPKPTTTTRTTTTPKPITTTPKPTTTTRTTTTPKPTTTTSKRTTTTPKPTTTTPKPTTTTRKPTTTTPKPTTTTSIPALINSYCNISTCTVLTENTLCKYSNTTWGDACQPPYPAASTVSAADIETILTAHNDYRRKVAKGLETQGNPGPQPPASNMRALEWSQELSLMAAAWARQCIFEHDTCRDVPLFKVGQNIAVSMSSADDIGTSNWSNPVADWYSEVQYMTSDYVSNFPASPSVRASPSNTIGHYTQLVWAETFLVGCATAYYQSTDLDSRFPYNRLYVCNYAPSGNFIGNSVYLQGTAGSACPESTTDVDGLCSFVF